MIEDTRTAVARARAYRRRRSRLVAASALLVVVLVFVAISVKDYFTVGEVRLPSVEGLAFPDAARVLRHAGLQPQAYSEDVPGVGLNVVTAQAPDAGTAVRKGRIIHLGVNNPPAATDVPPLVGLTEAQALRRTAQLKIDVASIDYRPDAKAAGVVVAQAPDTGTVLKPDDALSLTVSSGPPRQPVVLPKLTGMPYQDAVTALQKLGFSQVEALPGGVSFEKAGAVTALHPAAGTKVVPGTPITVFYALSGRTIVRVPSVLGLPLWQAQLQLQAARLVVGHVSYVQQADKPPGVLKAEPSTYTLPGTPVALTVNGTPGTSPLPPGGGAVPGSGTSQPQGTGSASGLRTVPFRFDPASMGLRRLIDQPYRLKLVVRDADGERTVFDREMKAGESVAMPVEVHGSSPLLQTYIDGVFFQAWRP